MGPHDWQPHRGDGELREVIRARSYWQYRRPAGSARVDRGCPSPISRTGKNEAKISLTLARLPAILRAMRDAFRTVAVLRSALSTRRDLLLEILALRHQLGVLGRSDRRFRPSDRLLWVCLRRLWPRWREALVLVQPATVARWHREGFRGCWRRRSRRYPGRPRIDYSFEASLGAWQRRT